MGNIATTVELFARDLWRAAKPRPPGVDVHFVSYPKCGRTWLELMLGMVLASKIEADADAVNRNLYQFCKEHDIRPVIHSTHDLSEITQETRNVAPASHLFYYDFRVRYWGRRVFMLVRDPRDTVVSSYYQSTKRAFNPVDVPDIDAFVLHPLYGFKRLIRFYEIWDRNAGLCTFHFESYEDLRSDTVGTMRRILGFLGIDDVSSDRLDQIVEECSFDEMRKMERVEQAGLRAFEGESAQKARKGRIGGYRSELRPETVEALDEQMHLFPARFGFAAKL